MKRSPKNRGRLSLQQLESRKLMAADFGLAGSTLAIQGSPMDDVAEVYLESDRVIVKVSTYDDSGQVVGEKEDNFAVDAIDRIVFEGIGGDDLLVNDSPIAAVARGGAGNDTLMGGTGNDLLVGGIGDDLILSGGGDDLILAGPGDDVAIETITQSADDVVESTVVEEEASSDQEPTSEVEPTAEVDPAAEVVDTVDELEPTSEVVDAEGEQTTEAADQAAEITAPVAEQPTAEIDDGLAICTAEEPSDELIVDVDPQMPTDDVAENVAEDVDQTVAEGEQSAANEIELEPELSNTESEMEAIAPTPVSTIAISQIDELCCLDNEDPVSEPVEETNTGSDPDDAQATGESENVDDAPVEVADEPETDDDVIFGGSGDDWIFGEGGRDLIFGNASPIDDALLRCVIAGRLRM